MNEPATDILIIDDDDMVRGALREVFEQDGHRVADEADGKAGIEAIIRLHPRIILCDVRMPGLNGYEVLAEVRRNHPELSGIPFVFLSGLSEKEYVAAGYKIGADDFVAKPVDFDLLTMKVDAMLRQTERVRKAVQAEKPAAAPSPERLLDEKPQEDKGPPAFEQRLKSFLESGGGASSGHLRVVSLEQVHEALGDEAWEKLKDKALMIAESVMRRMLGPNDHFMRHGDDQIMVLFDGVDAAAAELRMLGAADEIRRRLLGENYEKHKTVGVAADADDLERLASAEGGELTPETLAKAFERRAEEARAAEKKGNAGGDTSWFTDQLTCRFWPMWRPSNQSVIAYRAYPYRSTSYGVLSGPEVLHGGLEDPLAVDLDRFMASEILRNMSGGPASPGFVVLPLHFRTLAREDHGRVDEVLDRIPESKLKKRLIIEIVGIPEARGEPGIRRAVQFAQRYTPRIAVAVEPDDRHVGIIKGYGVTFLSLDVGGQQWGQAERDHVMKRVDAFTRKATALGIQTMVSGIDVLSCFKAAKQSGVALIGGRVISNVVDVVAQPYELSEARIVA